MAIPSSLVVPNNELPAFVPPSFPDPPPLVLGRSIPVVHAFPLPGTGTASSNTCSGLPLNWPVDDVYLTYPFQRHAALSRSIGYYFSEVRDHGREFWLRSDTCQGTCHSSQKACSECLHSQKDIERVASLAEHAAPHTNHKLLSTKQLKDHIKDRDERINSLKLKVCWCPFIYLMAHLAQTVCGSDAQPSTKMCLCHEAA